MSFMAEQSALRLLAGFFKARCENEPNPLYNFCACGLEELAESYPAYCTNAVVTAPFMAEINFFAKQFTSQPEELVVDVQGFAFMLFEALAAVMRETSFRTSKGYLEPPVAVLEFFERSGHWHDKDGTLVSEYYYSKIPNMLQNSFVAAKAG